MNISLDRMGYLWKSMEIYEFLDGISMEMIGILLTISPMSINFKVFAGV